MNYIFLVIVLFVFNLTIISGSRSSDFGKNVWQTRGDITSPPALTKCHKDNYERMERCVDQAFDSWKYYHKLEYESEQQLSKASCCAMWDARDCQMKIARHQCDYEAIDELYDSWEEAIRLWSRISDCYKYSYHYNSAKCKLTDWAIALIVIACILVVAFLVFFGFKCIKRRNRRKSLTFSSINYRQN
jgi:hypothetical protein